MRRDETCCDICGASIRVIGDTELLDGNLCQDCAKKLSPWFTDDLDCTDLEDIQAQLQGREQNLEDVQEFQPAWKFGFDTKILVDPEAGTFTVAKTRNLYEENTDIIRLDEVLDCTVSAEEDRAEIGPKQYRYRYQFKVDIMLDDHPYLDEIEFILNETPLEYISKEKGFLGFGGFDPEGEPDYDELAALGETIEAVLGGEEEVEIDPGCEVRPGEFITSGSGRGPKAEVHEDFQPGKIVTCPWCGSKTVITDRFCCQHCGGNL